MGNENFDLEDQNNVTEKLNKNEFQDEDVLEKALLNVGGFGRYQRILLIGMIPLGFTLAFVYFVQIFITVTPQNYWCRVPELANLSKELRQNLSSPVISEGIWDHCRTFDTNWTEVLDTLTVPPPETPTIPCPHGWEFDLSDIPYETVTSEREWVCDNASNVPIAQSLFFLGAIIGNVISGLAADRFGRIPAIIGTNFISGIGGIATAFTYGAWDFFLCRFIVGLGFNNCFLLPYILVLEYVVLRYRTIVANLFMASSFGIGSIILPWIAIYVSNWRLLLWVTSLPMFLAILAKWIVPESIRWLVSRDRVNDALIILKRFESINKAKIPDDVIDEFVISSSKAKFEENLSIIELLKNPILRKVMIKMIFLFMGNAVIFDGLMRLSDTFGLSLFIVMTWNEIFEFCGMLLVASVLDRFGRRNLSFIPPLISGILLTTSLFVPQGFTMATLAIVARFFMTMCLSASMQWCTEVLPTPFRACGSSTVHISAFIAIFVSPFIAFSGRLWGGLPVLIFALGAFSTTLISLTLPETKGRPLPQTVADVENLVKYNSLFGEKRK